MTDGALTVVTVAAPAAEEAPAAAEGVAEVPAGTPETAGETELKES
jgi:hypothetical protein